MAAVHTHVLEKWGPTKEWNISIVLIWKCMVHIDNTIILVVFKQTYINLYICVKVCVYELWNNFGRWSLRVPFFILYYISFFSLLRRSLFLCKYELRPGSEPICNNFLFTFLNINTKALTKAKILNYLCFEKPPSRFTSVRFAQPPYQICLSYSIPLYY